MHRKPKELAGDHITATVLGWDLDPGPCPSERTPTFWGAGSAAPAPAGVLTPPLWVEQVPAPPRSTQALSGTVHKKEALLACED